eukprot:NODE_177_length_15815_cov_0.395457.p4 type:complete len:495 gc:universal NODE_177_length_15815_cov_0.395457:9417-10901(+)
MPRKYYSINIESCSQGCINGKCMGIDVCACDEGYEGEDCTLNNNPDYLIIKSETSLNELADRRKLIDAISKWSNYNSIEYRSTKMEENHDLVKVALKMNNDYVAYSDLKSISKEHEDKYSLLNISDIQAYQVNLESFRGDDAKSVLFYFSCFFMVVAIALYASVFLKISDTEFQNSPKWLFNNYFFAVLLLLINIIITSFPSSRFVCVFQKITWQLSIITLSCTLALHVCEWYCRHENVKACERQFYPQNMKIYVIIGLIGLFLVTSQVLSHSLFLPTVVVSQNSLTCIPNSVEKTISIFSTSITIAMLLVSVAFAYKSRAYAEPKTLMYIGVTLPIYMIIYEIEFTNVIINCISKQACCTCIVLSILAFFMFKVFKVYYKVETEYSVKSKFKYGNLEKTSVKLTGVLPVRKSSGFYMWEQTLIELVVPFRYLCVSEGDRMILYKNFRIMNLNEKTNERFCFEIATNTKKFVCQCESKEELDTWMLEYQRFVDD